MLNKISSYVNPAHGGSLSFTRSICLILIAAAVVVVMINPESDNAIGFASLLASNALIGLGLRRAQDGQ